MTFWKISDTRMNCLVTESEIRELGYTLEDLTASRERTEEFLKMILEKGKAALGIEIPNGVQSFYGAFLPDKSLLLSISWQEVTEQADADDHTQENQILNRQVLFSTLDHVIQFCGVFGSGRAARSRLYKYDEVYYLMLDFLNTEEGKQMADTTVIAEEFGGLVEENTISELFLKEHELCLIPDHALEQLCEIDMAAGVRKI